MSGILKWTEPHNGGGYFTNKDTGLCNRIFHWELGYNIANINNMKMEVQKQWWPEMEFINLPLTKCVNKTNNEFVDDAYPFDTNILRHHNFKLDNTENWFPIERWAFNRYWWDMYFTDNEKIRPLQLIKIKDAKLRYLIESTVRGAIGIHIRKLIGVKGVFDPNGFEGGYEDVNKDVYIKFIEKILKFNPEQKFYLSTDLPLEKVNFLLDNYDMLTYKDILKDYKLEIGRRMIKRDNLLKLDTVLTRGLDKDRWRNKYPELVNKIKHYRYDLVKQNTLKDIADLFGLSFCDSVVIHPNSVWSEFAIKYNGQKNFVLPRISNISMFIERLKGYTK
jgi:hypothetical protein